MTAVDIKADANAGSVPAADPGAKATVENEASPRPKHDLPVLEAFRGLAAVMVVFTHVGFISGVGVAGAWAGWLSRLDFGVTLFFLLSGFLLFRPFVQAAYGRRPPVSVSSYLRRRYVRIYPALIVVLFFDYLLTPKARDVDISLWIYTLLMIQNYMVNFVNQLPGLVQGWSLCIEVSFYVCLPLIARLALGRGTAAGDASDRARAAREMRRARTPAEIRQAALERSRRPLLHRLLADRPWYAEIPALRPGLVLAAMALIAVGWRFAFLEHSGGTDNELLWLPSFLDWFAAGMGLAWLRERHTEVPRLIRDVASSAGACWSLALAGYWLTTTEVAGPYGLETPGIGATMLKHVVFLMTATLILLPAIFGNPAAGWRRVACNSFFSWLGRVSFGIFLWHPMLMEALRRMLRMEPLDGGFWLTLVLTLIASAVAGTLSWRFVEEPLQRRWRNGFGRRKSSAAPVARRPISMRRPVRPKLRKAAQPEPVDAPQLLAVPAASQVEPVTSVLLPMGPPLSAVDPSPEPAPAPEPVPAPADAAPAAVDAAPASVDAMPLDAVPADAAPAPADAAPAAVDVPAADADTPAAADADVTADVVKAAPAADADPPAVDADVVAADEDVAAAVVKAAPAADADPPAVDADVAVAVVKAAPEADADTPAADAAPAADVEDAAPATDPDAAAAADVVDAAADVSPVADAPPALLVTVDLTPAAEAPETANAERAVDLTPQPDPASADPDEADAKPDQANPVPEPAAIEQTSADAEAVPVDADLAKTEPEAADVEPEPEAAKIPATDAVHLPSQTLPAPGSGDEEIEDDSVAAARLFSWSKIRSRLR